MIKVEVPFWIDMEEFIERCKDWEVSFRKGKGRGQLNEWIIYVKDEQAKQIVESIIDNMRKELDEEIRFELEAYREEVE